MPVPFSTVPDDKMKKVGPYELPHADKACLLGCQRDAIMALTGVLCHVRDAARCGVKKAPPKSYMMLILKGKKDMDFEQARRRAIEYVKSNFARNVSNHQDARDQGLLPEKERPSVFQGSRQSRDKEAESKEECYARAKQEVQQEMHRQQVAQQMEMYEQQVALGQQMAAMMAHQQMQQQQQQQQQQMQQQMHWPYTQQPMHSAAQQQMAFRAARLHFEQQMAVDAPSPNSYGSSYESSSPDSPPEAVEEEVEEEIPIKEESSGTRTSVNEEDDEQFPKRKKAKEEGRGARLVAREEVGRGTRTLTNREKTTTQSRSRRRNSQKMR